MRKADFSLENIKILIYLSSVTTFIGNLTHLLAVSQRYNTHMEY